MTGVDGFEARPLSVTDRMLMNFMSGCSSEAFHVGYELWVAIIKSAGE